MSNVIKDSELRNSRLIFYENDVEMIDKVMEEFLKLSKARCALLVDKDGHMITRVGSDVGIDQDTVSALVAGTFAATKEMAKLLGEEEFSALYHQGESDNIQISLVGDRTILTVIFDDNTTLGMIRLYVSETVGKLFEIFENAKEAHKNDVGQPVSNEYSESAKGALDQIFEK